MPQLLELPRELRDMIYMAILTWELPRPSFEHMTFPSDLSEWSRSRNSQYIPVDDCDCIFPLRRPPDTCATFLATNRQINKEMMQTIGRARRKGMLFARIDCVRQGDGSHHFAWLSLPIVRTATKCQQPGSIHRVPGWAPNIPVIGRLLAAPQRRQTACNSASTSIEQLQIDIRLCGNDVEARRSAGLSDRTSWAICAALKTISENNSEGLPSRNRLNEVTIDTLILNIIPHKPSPTSQSPPQTSQPPDIETVSPHAVARSLVNVWNKLWAGDEARSRYYRNLLETIQRVRVCVDSVLVRERELRLELERGQLERKKIAMRIGW